MRGAYDCGLAGSQCLPRTPWRLGTEKLEPETAEEGEVGTKPECYLESADRSHGPRPIADSGARPILVGRTQETEVRMEPSLYRAS